MPDAGMAVAKSLDKILFLYTEHTDNTVSSVKMTEKLRPLREIRVQRASNPDFAIAMLMWVLVISGD